MQFKSLNSAVVGTELLIWFANSFDVTVGNIWEGLNSLGKIHFKGWISDYWSDWLRENDEEWGVMVSL